MKNVISIFTVCFSLLFFSCCKQQGIKDGITEYTADWESLSAHKQSPEWFADAKLGIYFTWGVYSVPAYSSEWYPFSMYRKGTDVMKHHTKTYGDPSDFSYHDFVPQFKAEYFDAEEWAKLFKEVGARFAGPCVQHHDGFAMWDSEVNPWNAADRGPKQDITGELEKNIKAQGLKFITTFHHARNLQRHNNDSAQWETYMSHYAYHPNYATSSTHPDTAKLYGNIPADEFHQYWFDQIKEVIDQYSPDIIWFDSWLKLIPEQYRQSVAAYYLNEANKKNKDVVIAYKQHDMSASVGVLDIEQGGKRDMSESVWLTDITLSNKSWSYIEGQTYKTANMVIRNMIDVWSKNGVVLLNLSPTASGIINREQRDVLSDIGQWMKKYAEAVYETRPFEVTGFGTAKAEDGSHGGQSATIKYTSEDGRFLMSKDGKTLYLFLLGKPKVGSVMELVQLAPHTHYPVGGIKRITVFGTDVEVPWEFGNRHVQITIPEAEMDDIATVFKIELN